MKTLFEQYPYVKPSETREKTVVVVRRKFRGKTVPRKGDSNYFVEIDVFGKPLVKLDTRTHLPTIAADYVALVNRDIKPDSIVFHHTAHDAEAFYHNLSGGLKLATVTEYVHGKTSAD